MARSTFGKWKLGTWIACCKVSTAVLGLDWVRLTVRRCTFLRDLHFLLKDSPGTFNRNLKNNSLTFLLNCAGIAAEEVLYACEENEETNSSSEMGLANPAVHFFRGLRHRNLSAIRHATQRGLHQLQQLNAHTEAGDPHARRVHGQTSLGVQGFRTNPKGMATKNRF